jgi:hypothetical protein
MFHQENVTNPSNSLPQLDHHIWDLHILLGLILSRDLKDHILLVFRNGFFTDMFHELAHPIVPLLEKCHDRGNSEQKYVPHGQTILDL